MNTPTEAHVAAVKRDVGLMAGALYRIAQGVENPKDAAYEALCAIGAEDLAQQSRVSIDPPERVSEPEDPLLYPPSTMKAVGTIRAGVERVSEASALREACQRLVDAHGVVTLNNGAGWTRHTQPVIYDIMKILRALDTKGGA